MELQINVGFELGRLVITANANRSLNGYDINAALARYKKCDWGKLCESDWLLNNNAVLNNDDRIFASYKNVQDKKFWIITEADRSYTTILLPEDY